jgi:hypothetical protein
MTHDTSLYSTCVSCLRIVILASPRYEYMRNRRSQARNRTQSNRSMNPYDTIPKSANEKLMPIKFVGRGKDGVVVLAVLRDMPNDPLSRRALKFLGAKHETRPYKDHIDKLVSIQDDPEYPLPKILERDEDVLWHTMAFVQGRSVQLLRNDHFPYGFPPCVVFRAFEQVVQQQLYLQQKGWCHIDLSGGGNVMLQNSTTNTVPSVTLIDYKAIQHYDQDKDHRVLKHVIELISMMTKDEERVPAKYRQRQNGSSFGANHVATADRFYKFVEQMISRNNWKKEKTLKEIWSEHGTQMISLVADLNDAKLMEDVESMLSDPVVTDQEISQIVADGGMKIDESYE